MKTVDKIDALKKLKEMLKDSKYSGLCTLIFSLYKITSVDQRTYLKSILPKRRLLDHPAYCWKPFAKAPRIKFIDAKIAQLEKRLH